MKKLFIGRSPLTTVVGYLLAALMGIHQAGAAGAHNWQDFLLPASIALLGRLSSDDSNRRPPLPPLPPVLPLPEEPVMPPAIATTAFRRRGREHKQKRGRNGQFAAQVA
ncbi:MAG: hypothetical protein JST27_05705 [Bacteroidetes bacterium]|nr:hypothetical protein [Bacteroidota bacterium]